MLLIRINCQGIEAEAMGDVWYIENRKPMDSEREAGDSPFLQACVIPQQPYWKSLTEPPSKTEMQAAESLVSASQSREEKGRDEADGP